ncbi:hypothetical protein ACWEPC_23655 [Nonomuraea sp. NPDC004297]
MTFRSLAGAVAAVVVAGVLLAVSAVPAYAAPYNKSRCVRVIDWDRSGLDRTLTAVNACKHPVCLAVDRPLAMDERFYFAAGEKRTVIYSTVMLLPARGVYEITTPICF